MTDVGSFHENLDRLGVGTRPDEMSCKPIHKLLCLVYISGIPIITRTRIIYNVAPNPDLATHEMDRNKLINPFKNGFTHSQYYFQRSLPVSHTERSHDRLIKTIIGVAKQHLIAYT